MEEDEALTIELMKTMIDNVTEIVEFRKYWLFEHLKTKEIDITFFKNLQSNLIKEFANTKTFGYMQDNDEWKKLCSKSH